VVFQVGEKVIYPNHGIGVVESIQTRPIPGGKISLYQLRILSNDSRVWVPQQNADGVGLRHVISGSDARKIFTILGDGTIEQHSNWKGRFKENSDKMRTGSLYEVAHVLKGLTFLSRKKALSFREKRMLDRAKFLLVSEIAEVEGKTHALIEERVDKALAKTFSPDVKALGPSVVGSVKPVQKPVGARRRLSDA
jgi:CarD family transcriptional regulator